MLEGTLCLIMCFTPAKHLMMQSLWGLWSKVSYDKQSSAGCCLECVCVSVHVCVDTTLLVLLQDTCDSHQANSNRSGHC